MALIGNYSSERADARPRQTLLVVLVACAVGATASATVIFFLASSPTTDAGAPSISPQAIVRNVDASKVPKTAQVGPVIEPTLSPRADSPNAGATDVSKAIQDGPVEPMPQPAATSTASGRDEPLTQTKAEHQTEEVQSQQSRKHGRVVRRWREPGRFARNSSPRPFGFW